MLMHDADYVYGDTVHYSTHRERVLTIMVDKDMLIFKYRYNFFKYFGREGLLYVYN